MGGLGLRGYRVLQVQPLTPAQMRDAVARRVCGDLTIEPEIEPIGEPPPIIIAEPPAGSINAASARAASTRTADAVGAASDRAASIPTATATAVGAAFDRAASTPTVTATAVGAAFDRAAPTATATADAVVARILMSIHAAGLSVLASNPLMLGLLTHALTHTRGNGDDGARAAAPSLASASAVVARALDAMVNPMPSPRSGGRASEASSASMRVLTTDVARLNSDEAGGGRSPLRRALAELMLRAHERRAREVSASDIDLDDVEHKDHDLASSPRP